MQTTHIAEKNKTEVDEMHSLDYIFAREGERERESDIRTIKNVKYIELQRIWGFFQDESGDDEGENRYYRCWKPPCPGDWPPNLGWGK